MSHDGTAYLLHFDEGLDNRPGVQARHYLGFTTNLESRLDAHERGRGSALMSEVKRRGIQWRLARVWDGVDRTYERKLKNRKNAPRLCPVCVETGGA
jgi:hypothetical protein